MFSVVGLSKNACFEEEPKPGMVLLGLQPLFNQEENRLTELVNRNLLKGNEEMLMLMYRRHVNLTHLYVTAKEFCARWNESRVAYYRELGLRVRRHGAAVDERAALGALVEMAQGKGGTDLVRNQPPETVWCFTHLRFRTVDMFVEAVKFGGACAGVTTQGLLKQITVVKNMPVDFSEILTKKDTHIKRGTLRTDGSVDGMTLYMIVQTDGDVPERFRAIPGLVINLVLSDCSLEQIVRQTASGIPYGENTRFAVCQLARLITKTMAYALDGDWLVYDANYFKNILGDDAGGAGAGERPRPVKTLRFLIS